MQRDFFSHLPTVGMGLLRWFITLQANLRTAFQILKLFVQCVFSVFLDIICFIYWQFKNIYTTFPCSVHMRIYSNLTVIRSMGTIKIITWYAFNNATWESVLVRILQYFYCVLITMPVTTSNYHSWLSNSVRPSANDHSKHGNIVIF